MTITRIFQESFDYIGFFKKYPWSYIKTSGAYEDTIVVSGFSRKFATTAEAEYCIIPSTSQLRIGVMVQVTGSVTAAPVALWLGNNGVIEVAFTIDFTIATNTWSVKAGATELGSFVWDPIDGNFHHFGIDLKIHASTGWFYFYVDGVAKVSYAGQTNQAGYNAVTEVGLSAYAVNSNFNLIYFDDLYIDDTSGETSAALVPKKSFVSLEIIGNGSLSEWIGSDGDSVNNYALIDEGVYVLNLFADFLESETIGNQDYWAVENSGLSPSDNISAIIVRMGCRNTTLPTERKAKVLLKDGINEAASEAKTVQVKDCDVWHRFTTAADGEAWTVAKIDSTEVGVELV